MREEGRAGFERGRYRKAGDAFIVQHVLPYASLTFRWFP